MFLFLFCFSVFFPDVCGEGKMGPSAPKLAMFANKSFNAEGFKNMQMVSSGEGLVIIVIGAGM